MKRLFFNVFGPTAPIVGAATLLAVACGPVSAADVPLLIKAPPQGPAASGHFWAEIDYLAWTVKGDRLPPLVTTSPPGTPPAQAGVLGAPGTAVLFGDSTVNDGWRSGGRVQAGYWFDPGRKIGIEASFFDLERASTGFNASSGGNPILARPFFDASANQQSAVLVAFPGLVSGSVAASESSRLLGAGVLYRQEIGSWGGERFGALIGYRYLHASDRVGISSAATATSGPLIGTVFGISDMFNATSDFHGLDLGVTGEFTRGPWMLEWRAKVALGANFNEAQINGSTTVAAAGVTTMSPGGLLALSSNIGNYAQTRFAVAPEIALKVGYQFAPGWRIIGGYDLLYWTGVQRAGSLIDTAINPNLIPPGVGPGPQRPQPLLNNSPLLAQGFSVGLKYEF
jgi:Putative beta barrel porin-7 (BBP7)